MGKLYSRLKIKGANPKATRNYMKTYNFTTLDCKPETLARTYINRN